MHVAGMWQACGIHIVCMRYACGRHVVCMLFACGRHVVCMLYAYGRHVELQVIFTTACELVRPKHVVPGTLKILQGQIQFTGDLSMDEGASGVLPDSPAPKGKVMALTRGLSVAEPSGDDDMRCLLM